MSTDQSQADAAANAAPDNLQPGVGYNKVGLTEKDGTVGTPFYMPSDATLALDQGIEPTWTGEHKFQKDLHFVAPDQSTAATLNLDGKSIRYTVTDAKSAHEFYVGGTSMGQIDNPSNPAGGTSLVSKSYVDAQASASSKSSVLNIDLTSQVTCTLTADQLRNSIIRFYGTPQGDVDVTLSTSGRWFIIDECDVGHTINLFSHENSQSPLPMSDGMSADVIALEKAELANHDGDPLAPFFASVLTADSLDQSNEPGVLVYGYMTVGDTVYIGTDQTASDYSIDDQELVTKKYLDAYTSGQGPDGGVLDIDLAGAANPYDLTADQVRHSIIRFYGNLAAGGPVFEVPSVFRLPEAPGYAAASLVR